MWWWKLQLWPMIHARRLRLRSSGQWWLSNMASRPIPWHLSTICLLLLISRLTHRHSLHLYRLSRTTQEISTAHQLWETHHTSRPLSALDSASSRPRWKEGIHVFFVTVIPSVAALRLKANPQMLGAVVSIHHLPLRLSPPTCPLGTTMSISTRMWMPLWRQSSLKRRQRKLLRKQKVKPSVL